MHNQPGENTKNIAKKGNQSGENRKLGLYAQFQWNPPGESEKDGTLDIKLSDGSELTHETIQQFLQALKNATGIDESAYSMKTLIHIARGLQGNDLSEKLSHIAALLPALKPQDPTEAMLAGQFLSLQEAGLGYLRRAASQDHFYHLERYTLLANKLLNTANQTMQTLIKYRSRGQQTVQVIHMHNNGQAVLAQNVSHPGGGAGKKSEN